MVTKKARKEFLETVFMGFEGMFRTDGHSFEVSVWDGMYKENYIVELSRLLSFIADSPYIGKSYDVWRDVGYYDCTDDIYMRFEVNVEKVKKDILEDRKNA
jgi:hypothetical protein